MTNLFLLFFYLASFFISAFLGSFWLAFFRPRLYRLRRSEANSTKIFRLKRFLPLCKIGFRGAVFCPYYRLNALCRYAKSAKYKKRRQKARRTTINLPQICKNRPYAADSSRSLPHLRLGYAVRRFTPPYRLFGVCDRPFSGRAVLARKARSIGRQSYLRPRASG